MTASSVTGRGEGASNKPTTNELAILNNGPQIIFAGSVEGVMPPASPPMMGMNTVSFPYPLPGNPDNYVIQLTGLNSGYAYVSARFVNASGFTGFEFVSQASGAVMYTVMNAGIRPNITL